jgi:hypothetical protein
MRRWAASGGDVHINEAESPRSVLPGKKNGVRISNDPNVRKLFVKIRLSNYQGPVHVVCGDGRGS